MYKKLTTAILVTTLLFIAISPVLAQQDGDNQLPLADENVTSESNEETPDGNTEQASSTSALPICDREAGLGICINQLYVLSLGLSAILAVFMIVISGYKYMTAGGNAQQVESAKESFVASFIGVIVIFVAYILLRQINPDLTEFKNLVEINNQLELPAIGDETSTEDTNE